MIATEAEPMVKRHSSSGHAHDVLDMRVSLGFPLGVELLRYLGSWTWVPSLDLGGLAHHAMQSGAESSVSGSKASRGEGVKADSSCSD